MGNRRDCRRKVGNCPARLIVPDNLVERSTRRVVWGRNVLNAFMTRLLERAVAEAARLTDTEQDAIAANILAEIDDEREWDRLFSATSDGQWDQLAAMARKGIEVGGSKSLEDLIGDPRG